MRQLFRVTAADFAPKEPTIDDAIMNEDDMNELRRLAGLPMLETRDQQAHAGNNNPSGLRSPMGSNISATAMEKKQIEHEKNIKPGSPEWFRLWFSKPYLTGEKPVGDESGEHSNSLMSVNVPPPVPN